jgi:23S rRNA pseudouridine1911/1915/1917 synthase
MNYPDQTIILKAIVPVELGGKRLDQAVAQLFPDYSRSRLQQWIKDGQLKVNGVAEKAKSLVHGGEQIDIEAHPIAQENWAAQDIPLQVIYEDDDVLVINKPAGLVVHPAAGNFDNTLVNALLHHAPTLTHLPRAGIVHRLDKDTTGLLIVAKTLAAHTHLVAALQARNITREYECIVNGVMVSGGTIDEPIGRNPHDRLKQAINQNGKPAVTHYRVIERYRRHTRLQVNLETGRTHQIRVHMAHLHHPLIGDTTYGGRVLLPPQASLELTTVLRQFKRQALHARKLVLEHPISKKTMCWEAELPTDMQMLIHVLQEDTHHATDNP